MKQWLARKSLERLHSEMQDDNRLRRVLGPVSLSALGVGAIIGWDLVLEYAMACATVAASWSHYLDELLRTTLGWQLPERIAADPFTSGGASWLSLPAVLIMLAVTVVLVMGIRESALMNTVLVIVKVCVVLFVIAVGTYFVDPTNWTGIPVADRHVPADPVAKWGLMAFVIVCAAVLILRRQRPDAPRPFRCPCVYVVAPLGILVNGTMMLFLPLDTWLRLFVWLAIGLAIHFLYGQRNSVLGKLARP